MGFDYVAVARDFAKRRGLGVPLAPLPAHPPDAEDLEQEAVSREAEGEAAFVALVEKAVNEMGKRYVPGALAWTMEHRLDLAHEIAEAEAAVGGISRWRPFGPAQLAELREVLTRWWNSYLIGVKAFCEPRAGE